MELDTLGDRKTALFVIISDTDDTFNFVVSILYTQLFNLLCDKADDVYGGRLPVDVYKRQSFNPMDLLIGIVGAGVIRLAVYVNGKNAKKYRKGMEYGLSLIHI